MTRRSDTKVLRAGDQMPWAALPPTCDHADIREGIGNMMCEKRIEAIECPCPVVDPAELFEGERHHHVTIRSTGRCSVSLRCCCHAPHQIVAAIARKIKES